MGRVARRQQLIYFQALADAHQATASVRSLFIEWQL